MAQKDTYHTVGGKMKISIKLLAAGSSAALLMTLAACGGGTATTGGAPGGGGKVVVGVKFDQPGLGLKEGNDNTGFDVEVARYVAKDLGYTEVEFKESPSAQRETLLQSDQVKMIFATYSITDDRKKKVSFAGPYFVAGQDLLVKADNADITGPESLNGKKLCSVTGSTSAKKVKDNFANTVQLQEYDTYSKCVEALNSGSIDAVTTDNVILAGFAAQDQYKGKLKVVGKTFSEERYGVGIKMGDTDLCSKINAAIEKMVSDGSWQKALDATVGPSGFKHDTATNPPKADACS
jgi:glutamate transport system substrate-binding protein